MPRCPSASRRLRRSAGFGSGRFRSLRPDPLRQHYYSNRWGAPLHRSVSHKRGILGGWQGRLSGAKPKGLIDPQQTASTSPHRHQRRYYYALAMEKEAFEAEFREGLLRRLEPIGFVFNDGLRTMSLIRFGGRMARPGAITHLLCFRHSFLRDRTERVPTTAPMSPFDYRYKIRPSLALAAGALKYRPQNLRFDFDTFHWSHKDAESISAWVGNLGDLIADHLFPWAESLTPFSAKSEIETHGEGAWCERMWINDYAGWLSDQT